MFVGVGYVVPALIAHDMGRQGVRADRQVGDVRGDNGGDADRPRAGVRLPGVNDLAPLAGFGDMSIDTAWLPFAVLLSAAAAWGVATNYGMRSGGFVGAAFIAMFMGDPWQVIVAGRDRGSFVPDRDVRLLMNHMILFGRRKFSSMLLVASSLSWVLLWSGREFFGPEVQRHLDLGSLALTPLFLPGLIANDVQRTSPRKVVLGVAMASTFVLSWTWWAQSLFEGLALAMVWKVTAVAALGAIFWRQVVPVRGRNTADDTAVTADVVHVVPPAVPVRVAAPPPTGVAAAFGMGGYHRWAAAHPVAAQAAERWLTAIVGDGTVGVPSLALPAAGPIDTGWSPRRGLVLRRSNGCGHPPWPPGPARPHPRQADRARVVDISRIVDISRSEQDPLRVDQIFSG